MEDRLPIVVGRDGLRGRLVGGQPESGTGPLLIEFDNGSRMHVDANTLTAQQDGTYSLPMNRAELDRLHARSREIAPQHEDAIVFPVVQESLDIGKRVVEKARVRITRQVQEREEVIDDPLLREEVVVEHVPVNKYWEGPAPAARYEGDKLIIPLIEEVIVLEKRLMLREEVHVSRIQKTVIEPQTVVLRSEQVAVERIEPSHSAPAGLENEKARS